ncbi:hypothetical protein OVA24_06655 [Luteolibacter sp. SL250]|uniref:hypothetical protein n=1 Tax=Luteolibacter sp. SL250 TaxID=2995170 RepID=UPI00227131A7|nr:hypothetical protein [Luteolibacter sp. SL250]WAC21062.1 hypothetical protein OVA24_06655 [Luteolibacter sp. SL250]
MKVPALLVCATSFASAHAAELTPEETKELMAGVKMVEAAFEKKDVPGMVEHTHPAIHKLLGGKEAFAKVTEQAMAQIAQQEIRVLDNQYGPPSKVHLSGTDRICFIPRTNVMHIKDMKIKSTGFLIAIRSEGQPWKFLDGAALRQNPELLKTLFPGLPDDVEQPENRMEPITD